MSAADALARLRELCLALPAVHEKRAWSAPTFRVRDRMFAMFDDHHHGVDHVAVWCHAPPGVQALMVADDPKNFFVPPYMGPKGWVGVRLDRGLSDKRLAAALEQAYQAALASASKPRTRRAA